MLHVGLDRMVDKKDILMILDASRPMAAENAALLERLKKEHCFTPCDGMKSIVLVTQNGTLSAIASPINATTLLKRSESNVWDEDAP